MFTVRCPRKRVNSEYRLSSLRYCSRVFAPPSSDVRCVADAVFSWAMVLAICTVFCGCASYTAIPIAPPATMRAFEARTLDSPELQSYVASHLAAGSVSGKIRTWDLETLTLAAFYFSPNLDLARAKNATADAATQTASQRPNPSLQLPFQYGTNPKSGDSPYTLGLGLDIPIETAGKRGYRVAQARQLSVAARFDVGNAAWQVRSQLRAQLLDLFVARRRGRLLDRQVKARQQVVEMLDKRLSVGAVSTPEVQQAGAALMQERLALIKVNGQVFDALAGAAAVIGLPFRELEKADVRLDAFATDPPDLPDEAARERALLNRADLLSALADYEASQAALQLEVANQYPDIHLGPGYTFDAGVHKFGLSLTGIALPLFNRNEGPIAEAAARREEAAARFTAAQAQAIAVAERAAKQYHTALTFRSFSEALRANRERQLTAVRKSYEAGVCDRLGLTLAEIDAYSAALAQEDAFAQMQRASGEVEDAMHLPLSARATSPR